MNITQPAAPATPQVGQLFNFVEQACFHEDDTERTDRMAVVFRLFSVGRALGQRLDVHFTSNYGIYYGSTDQELVEALCAAAPAFDWSKGYVFHRWLDRSRIQVLCEATGKIVAQVETRRYFGRKVTAATLAAGQHGPNVVTLDQLRTARIARACAQLAAARQQAEVAAETEQDLD